MALYDRIKESSTLVVAPLAKVARRGPSEIWVHSPG
jgi:hypothetical protein